MGPMSMSRTVTLSVPASSDSQAASASMPIRSVSSSSGRIRVTPSRPSTSRPSFTGDADATKASMLALGMSGRPTGSGVPRASVATNAPFMSAMVATPEEPSVSRRTVYSTPWNSNVASSSAPAVLSVRPVTASAAVSAYP